jgi:hypothetical protein
MAANTSPIYSLTPNIKGVAVTAGNTNSDGTGTVSTNMFQAYTAGTNGSYVSVIRWSAVATTAASATTATVGRIFVCNLPAVSGGACNNTNTWLFAEFSLASQSADHTTNATFFIEVPVYKALPSGWAIMVTNHVAPTGSTSWQAVVYGGDY